MIIFKDLMIVVSQEGSQGSRQISHVSIAEN